jgi:hypothetical protein
VSTWRWRSGTIDAVHARAMVATGLSFTGPVFARVFTHLGPPWPGLSDHGSNVVALAVMAAVVQRARRRVQLIPIAASPSRAWAALR